MKSTQIIESSLNKKIKENEKKMQNLLSAKSNKSRSLYYIQNYTPASVKTKNKKHIKNKSQEEIKLNSNKPKKLKMQFSTIQNEDHSDDSMNLVKKIEKRLKSYSKSANKRDRNKLICHKFANNINAENSNSKKVNKDEIDKIVNRLYTNEQKKKENEKIKSINLSNKKEKQDSKSSKVNFNEIYSRFQEDIKKRSENLEKKREEIQNNNKNIYTYKPKLNINKKFFDSENTNSFIERQRKFIEDKKQKEEKFKENLIKKKQEEIDKSNILVKHSFNKKDIIRGINDLTEWENNRKRKLEERQKQIEEEKINKYKYRPKIDKNSILLASKNIQRQKESNVFMRLAQDDKVLKEKKKILIQLNTPSFRPELYKTKRKKFIMNSNKVKEFDTVSKRYKSEVNMDNSDLDIEDEKYDESYDSNGNGEKDDYIDSNIFTEENIQNAYRKAIFHKRKK